MQELDRTTTTGHVTRRTIAKGAAWSLPVVAVAAAAPSANASKPVQDVDVDASCYGLNIGGLGLSYPQFSIIAVGAPIAAGSTFTLTSDGLANVTLGADNALIDIGIIAGKSRTITLKKTIPVGGVTTIRITGLLSAQVLKSYVLSATTIIGNTNDNHSNDSATQYLTGVSIAGIIAGYCGSKHSVATAHARNLATYRTMSAHQKQELVAKVAGHH